MSEIEIYSEEILRVIEHDIPADAYSKEALIWMLQGYPDLEMNCDYCNTKIDFCCACGIPCLCNDNGPLCNEHTDDSDLISPEEAEWMYEQGIKIPVYPVEPLHGFRPYSWESKIE